MKVLNKQELKKAEEALRPYFPQSLQVYGYVFLLNRLELEPTDVLVDRWPDFRVLLVKQGQQQKTDFIEDVCVFTEDESCLRNVLIRTDALDWKRNLNLNVNLQHKEVIKAVAMNKGVAVAEACVWHLMELQDPSKLTAERLSVQVSSVSESHAPLINSKWKFGKGELTVPLVKNMIRNFPSCCVLDSEGRPVSWILTCYSCAMGMLYTLPEHRQKGYAKALVSILAKKLHSEGYPVYCFVVEENQPSFRLFTKLGFTEDPSYRTAMYYIN